MIDLRLSNNSILTATIIGLAIILGVFASGIGNITHSGNIAESDHKIDSARDMIDPNTSSLPSLCRIPGIGPAIARKIITYRETHGPFQTIDDMKNVKGIGPATIIRIEPYIEFTPSEETPELAKTGECLGKG